MKVLLINPGWVSLIHESPPDKSRVSFFNFRLNLISQTPWGENREQVSNCPALNPGHPGLSYQCSATELQQPDNRKKADGTSKVSSSEDNFTHLSWATRATLVWWLSRVYQHSDTRMWTLDPATLMISSTLSFSFCGQCFYLHKIIQHISPSARHFQESYMLCEIWRGSNFAYQTNYFGSNNIYKIIQHILPIFPGIIQAM